MAEGQWTPGSAAKGRLGEMCSSAQWNRDLITKDTETAEKFNVFFPPVFTSKVHP